MARPAITNVSLSGWSKPKTNGTAAASLNAGLNSFANLPASVATSDTITVDADYGIYDTTHAGNVTVEATNLKDTI
jgi:hypothetical protein